MIVECSSSRGYSRKRRENDEAICSITALTKTNTVFPFSRFWRDEGICYAAC